MFRKRVFKNGVVAEWIPDGGLNVFDEGTVYINGEFFGHGYFTTFYNIFESYFEDIALEGIFV